MPTSLPTIITPKPPMKITPISNPAEASPLLQNSNEILRPPTAVSKEAIALSDTISKFGQQAIVDTLLNKSITIIPQQELENARQKLEKTAAGKKIREMAPNTPTGRKFLDMEKHEKQKWVEKVQEAPPPLPLNTENPANPFGGKTEEEEKTNSETQAASTTKKAENDTLTEDENKLKAQILEMAKKKFLEHRNFWTGNKPSDQDILGLLKIAIASDENIGASTMLELMADLKAELANTSAAAIETMQNKLASQAHEQDKTLINLAHDKGMMDEKTFQQIQTEQQDPKDALYESLKAKIKKDPKAATAFLQDPRILGSEFSLELGSVFKAAGVTSMTPQEVGNFEKTWKDMTTTDQEKVFQAMKKTGKFGGGALVFLLLMALQGGQH